MDLYNSLSKRLETLTPLDDSEVRIYSCGPTVYERAHIGNLSSFIYADTLRRVLEASGYKVMHVMNITDVDDKTIAKSQQEHPELEPMEALQKTTAKYEKLFMDDLKAVGVDVGKIKFVRATDNIEAMQDLIRKLVAHDVAYIADDGIYFSIKNYEASGKKYGRLVNVTPASTKESRIDNDEYDKDNAHDFALWKARKPGEPAWDFELDGQNIKGRPGWHIECSAMSQKYLGQPFDIHTGGVDLKFPHHENEIAQSTAANDKELAMIFLHSEHMLIDNRKMSKSLNNFLTLEDITNKGYDPLAFRLFVLEGKYNTQRSFSFDELDDTQKILKKFQSWSDGRFQDLHSVNLKSNYTAALSDIKTALLEDLNTHLALSVLNGMVKRAEELGLDSATVAGSLVTLDNLFGLNLQLGEDVNNDQLDLLKAREAARQKKDWAKSDELRDKLAEQGIGINDTDDGPIWYRL